MSVTRKSAGIGTAIAVAIIVLAYVSGIAQAVMLIADEARKLLIQVLPFIQ